MDHFQSLLDEVIEEAIAKNPEENPIDISKNINSCLTKIIEKSPASILESIKNDAFGGGLEQVRATQAQFVGRNREKWKHAFDHIETLIEICAEAGSNVNRRLRPSAVTSQDILFDTLTRLHAKSCLLAREIYCLLVNGFPDGAHARWRALHELVVTSIFLKKSDSTTVEKFRHHQVVDAYKGARQHSSLKSRLQAHPPSEHKLSILQEEYEELKRCYGNNFKNPYGWAEEFLNITNRRATFADIEKAVGLDHWRPYYKLASQNIHATAQTISFSLAVFSSSEDILLTGPSDSGLIDPAHSMSISLTQVTANLLSYSPNLDDAVYLKVIESLCADVGKVLKEYLNK